MNVDVWERAARDAFEFLDRELGCTLQVESQWYGRFLTYRCERAFVRLDLDTRDRVFNVLFGPLVDHEVPPYPIFLERDDEPILWFPLWAVLLSRGVEPPPFSFADERLERELTLWAAALREHASGPLRGDFSGLDEPVREIKREQYEAALERDERLYGP